MALIDSTFFQGNLLIPNLDKDTVQATVEYYINEYENKFLESLMGLDLYTKYVAEAVDVTPLPARWADVVNGKTGNKWRGLIYTPGANEDFKKSPVANYVYFHYMRDTHTQSTGIGEVKTKAENADTVSPSLKMIRAWNEMVDDVYHFWNFVYQYGTLYPEWTSTHVYNYRREFQKINQFNI
jgi:hypothetical protein